MLMFALFGSCGRGTVQEAGYMTSYDYDDAGNESNGYGYTDETSETASSDNAALPRKADTHLAGHSDAIHGLISVVEYGGNRAYIMGSIHIGREDWYPLSPVVEAAMDSADVFAFEIDLGASGGPCICGECIHECDYHADADECMCLLMDMMFFPEGTTLADFLPADVYEIFMENLNTFPVYAEAFAPLRPTTVSEFILYEIVAPALGLSSEHSIDMYVFNRAQGLSRPTIGLTCFNAHVAFISGMPDEYQIATARYFSDFDTALEEVEELAHIYETQDIEALIQAVTTGLAEAYEAYAAGELSAGGLGLARYWHYTVGNYRSAFFARQVADLLTQTEEPTTFFVTVGIAHLTRDINVFYVLQDMGFEVVGLHP